MGHTGAGPPKIPRLVEIRRPRPMARAQAVKRDVGDFGGGRPMLFNLFETDLSGKPGHVLRSGFAPARPHFESMPAVFWNHVLGAAVGDYRCLFWSHVLGAAEGDVRQPDVAAPTTARPT